MKSLTLADFVGHINDTFDVQGDVDEAVSIRLIAANSIISNDLQENFDVVFKGPLGSFLPQSVYTFEIPVQGKHEIFLVPIGQEPDGFIYQAVFNYLHPKQAEAAA